MNAGLGKNRIYDPVRVYVATLLLLAIGPWPANAVAQQDLGQVRNDSSALAQDHQIDAAIKLLEDAKRKFENQPIAQRAGILVDLGMYYQMRKRTGEAEKQFQAGVDLLKGEDKLNSDTGAVIYTQLGNLYLSQNKLPIARNHLETALDLLSKAKVPENDFRTQVIHGQLSQVCFILQDFEAVEMHLKKTIRISSTVNGYEHPNTINAVYAYCNFLNTRGRPNEAIDNLKNVVPAVKKHFGAMSLEASGAYGMLANFIKPLKPKEAIEAAEKSLEIASQISPANTQAVDSAKYLLGTCYRAAGQTAKARLYLEQVASDGTSESSALTATALLDFAEVAMQLYDVQAALPAAQKALAILQNTAGAHSPETARAHLAVANTISDIAPADQTEGHFLAAINILEKSLGYRNARTITAYHDFGWWLVQRRGDQNRARVYLEAAVRLVDEISEKSGEPEAANIYRNSLAGVLEFSGDFEAALQNYRKSFEWVSTKFSPSDSNYTSVLHNLSVSEFQNGNFQRAAQFQGACRRGIQKHVNELLGDLPKQDQLRFLDQLYRLRFHVALSYLTNKQFKKQSEEHQRALVNDSAQWLLNGKALTLSLLARRQKDILATQSPLVDELAQVQQLLGSLAMAEKTKTVVERIGQLTTEEAQLSREISASVPLKVGAWTSVKQVQSALSDDEVLIEFARYDSYNFEFKFGEPRYYPARYSAWVIPAKGDVKFVDLGEASIIDDAIGQLQKMYNEPAVVSELVRDQGEVAAVAQWNQVAKNATDLLWKPIAQLLPKTTSRLVVSPDSNLWLLPWAAIPVSDDKFLLEDFGLQFVVSGRDLLKDKVDTAESGRPIVFAAPDFDLNGTERLQSMEKVLRKKYSQDPILKNLAITGVTQSSATELPYTKAESEAVAPRMTEIAGAETRVYTGQWALETILKVVRNPRFLVLSTHGFALAKEATDQSASVEDPLLRSGLLMAGYNSRTNVGGDDGIVTGLDIVNLSLQGTELVVLSACETAVGQVDNGEGVAGLRQAFQIAGAESVVAALWKVPDSDTAIIMKDLFSQLSTSTTKQEALRKAQLKRIATRRSRFGAAHPFYWAAWTITGSAGRKSEVSLKSTRDSEMEIPEINPAVTSPNRDTDSAEDLFVRAQALQLGVGQERAPKKAVQLYEKATEQNYSPAFFELAQMYHYGDGVDENGAKAIELYEKVDSSKKSKALFEIGGIYYSATGGIEEDKGLAAKYFEQAASAGYGIAQYKMSLMYSEGDGVPEDKSKAFAWLEKAAKQNIGDSAYGLAIMYEEGNGVEKNDELAFEWFLNSANGGEASAQYLVGSKFRRGEGVEKDLEKAVYYLSNAAQQNNPYAQDTLGDMYRKGEGIEKDLKQAAQLYEKSADQGNKYAQDTLGDMYRKGEGVAKNLKRAAQLYEKSGGQGYKYAQRRLAWLYRDGEGVEKNLATAISWFRKAAEQGDLDAQNELGYMLNEGLGTKKDEVEAVKWYRKAALQGHTSALGNLALAYNQGDGVKQDKVEAAKWYRKACEQGNHMAQSNFGYMLLHGPREIRDPKEAAKWLLKSSEQGNRSAQYNLAKCFQAGNGIKKNISEAVRWFHESAQQDHISAQYDLAKIHLNGDGVSKNYKKAIKWFRTAADLGHGRSQYQLGKLYRDGKHVKKDYKKALDWFLKAAKQGNADAQNQVGIRYDTGQGTSVDDIEACKWYRKAAEQGHAWAQYNLGLSLLKGEGVAKDENLSFKWILASAKQANSKAQNQVGALYDKGIGIEENDQTAFRWYKKSAENGLALGQRNLAVMYWGGHGTEKDYSLALQWYRKAADQGLPDAQTSLGTMYYQGNGVPVNYDLAAHWWTKAAKQGDRDTQFALAKIIYMPESSPKRDSVKAVFWYEKAAAQGHDNARVWLGSMYLEGKGVPENHSKAAALFRKAADRNDSGGQHWMGLCYATGRGVPQDYAAAARYFHKAAKQGDADSQEELGRLYLDGDGVKQSDALAVQWIRKAAEQGHDNAQNSLGFLYLRGRGVPQNSTQAVYWFRKAEKQGHETAGENLRKLGY